MLYSFKGGNDGNQPVAGLVFDSHGALYGTTQYGGGGTFGPGTVFKLTPPVRATQWTETVLHRFGGSVTSAAFSTQDLLGPIGDVIYS